MFSSKVFPYVAKCSERLVRHISMYPTFLLLNDGHGNDLFLSEIQVAVLPLWPVI